MQEIPPKGQMAVCGVDLAGGSLDTVYLLFSAPNWVENGHRSGFRRLGRVHRTTLDGQSVRRAPDGRGGEGDRWVGDIESVVCSRQRPKSWKKVDGI